VVHVPVLRQSWLTRRIKGCVVPSAVICRSAGDGGVSRVWSERLIARRVCPLWGKCIVRSKTADGGPGEAARKASLRWSLLGGECSLGLASSAFR
jgi:hypothetical protein